MKRNPVPCFSRAVGPFTVAAALLFSLPSAQAQGSAELNPREGDDQGLDVHLFRPSLDSKGFISTNGTDILGHQDYSFGLVIDLAFGIMPYDGFEWNTDRGLVPLVSVDPLTNDAVTDESKMYDTSDHLVDFAGTGTLHFNYGFWNTLVVGLQVPIQVVSGPNMVVPGAYNDDPNPLGLDSQGFGDLSIHGKVRILRRESYPVGLAGVLQIGFPTGNSASLRGEPGVSLWPIIVGEWMPAPAFRIGLNAGYRFNSGQGALLPFDGRIRPVDDEANRSPDLLSIDPANPMCRADAAGVVTNATCPGPVEGGTEVEYDDLITFGVSAAWRFVRAASLVADLYGGQIASGFGDTGALGIEATGGLKIFVEENSYLLLAGGLGVVQSVNSADIRGILGFVFEPSIGDRDGDGYKDDVDKCPDEPEDFDGFEDEEGCPDPDNDRDGILDVDDECPNDPEDKDNFQDEDGCPDPDNDKDRILDVDDSCPNDPETYNGFEDEDGCPDRGNVVIEENQIIILEKIYFATNSAEILEKSFPIVDAVAATLVGNPQLKLVEIQGHADERASDQYNIDLTRDRAASVRQALIQRGVEPNRMRSAGYGERCPVDPAHNAAAWEKNRRVEFKIIETEMGPTGVEVTCAAAQDLIPNR
jgi:OOP family OmpA-OmpF porin